MMFTTLTRLARPAAAQQRRNNWYLSHRTFVRTAPRADGRLPYHVVGMPALSPTMDSGAREWHVAEGDSLHCR
jgi:hypothetical protein